MSLWRQLTDKPWLTPGVEPEVDGAAAGSEPAAWTGLRIYFGVVTVIFMLMGAAYLMRMGVQGMGHDMGAGHGDWRPMPEPPLLWFNTLVLILSSAAWELARTAVDRGRTAWMRMGPIVGGALALVFLAGQLAVWQQLDAAGYVSALNPANAFFYMITAVHGVHLLGGLVVWGRTVVRLAQGAELAEVRLSIELCALYWHFLLLVWLVMFGLLLMT